MLGLMLWFLDSRPVSRAATWQLSQVFSTGLNALVILGHPGCICVLLLHGHMQ